jgi:hypothetical protein
LRTFVELATAQLAAVGLSAALLSSGCNGRTHDGSDEAGDAADPKEDTGSPDMAPDSGDGEDCGGADLQTDRLNCGECGHICHSETTYGHPAGDCVAGACSPQWTTCRKEGSGDTCAEVCDGAGTTCAPQACDGLTAIFLTEAFEDFPGCVGEDEGLTIGCNEPLPWSPDPSKERVFCCCEQD